MDTLPYLFAAYTIIWALVFGYMLMMSSRQGQLRREVDSLRQALKEVEKRDQGF